MKILLVHNAYQQPGGEDVVFAQERQLLECAGHQVLSYCRSNDEVRAFTGIKSLQLSQQLVWASDTRREVNELLLREKPQLVHIHNTFMMVSPSIYAACRDAQVPVVQTLHNYRLFCPAANFFRAGQVCEECVDRNLWQSVRHGCYHDSRAETAAVALMLAVHRGLGTWTRMVDCYIALTEFARRKFVDAGLPPEKIVVKPNFVRPAIHGRSGPGEYALFVGRLSPEKGLKTLLDAWTRLRHRIPLLVVGDGPLRSELSAEVERRSLSNVLFRSHLSRDETLAVMRGARFLILPSACYENFPMTIVEAFSCATPVICSRLGALQEIVEHGATGLHFSPSDPQDLSDKVDWAWERPDRMEHMGEQAERNYEVKYTPERNYRMLMAIYERAMAARNANLERRPEYAVMRAGNAVT